jgi:outer membrane usher protein
VRTAGALATALLALALPAAFAQPDACSAGLEGAAAAAPLLVQPVVNGAEREGVAVRFLPPAGPLYVGEAELAEWGLALDKLTLQDSSGARWLCVEGLGLPYRLDPAQLTLRLDFPAQLHAGSRLSFTRDDTLPVTYMPGGFLNYDLRLDRGTGPASLSANWEVGAFSQLGVLTSSFLSGNQGRGTLRLDTTFRHDDPQRITSFVAGDTITRPGTYGAALRMAGLQYQRNFANAPLLVTYPQADVAGSATVPSTVDIFIGNAKAYSTPVKPGPFTLASLPVPVGAGNVRVVVRDVFGKETTAVVPYVRYDAMLKQGLHDFSYEAGALRRNYAVQGNDYRQWAAVATHRYGVTDRLTVEGRAEAMADRGNLGGVVQATLPVLGLVGVAAAASTGLGHGTLGKIFVQRNEPAWSLGLEAEQRSPDYVDIAYEPAQVRTLAVRQFSASARISERNWVNLLGLHTRDTTGEFNSATLGWTFSLTRSATLSANFSRFWGTQPASSVVSLTLALPLGERDFATATVERRSETAKPDVLLEVNRNLLETDSFGYHLLAGQQFGARRGEAGAFVQTGVGQFGVEVAQAPGARAARAYARGGIAAAGGTWRLSRYLDQSFAIVKVADLPGVRVYGNGQPVGATDGNGVAVIPRLSGFLPGTIAFEAEDVPLDGSFTTNQLPLKLASRMGAFVDMGVTRRISATLTLVKADGQPVPAGAVARVGESLEEFPVARRGRVYVSGLTRGRPNALRVQIGERACVATVALPAEFASGGTLGDFTCR